MASTHAGMLFIEKTNLEATLKQLSDEVKIVKEQRSNWEQVEVVSERNEKLLKDLKIKDFFEEYEKASNEVRKVLELKRIIFFQLLKLREEFNGFLKKTKLIKQKSPRYIYRTVKVGYLIFPNRKEGTNLKKLFAINCGSVQKY